MAVIVGLAIVGLGVVIAAIVLWSTRRRGHGASPPVPQNGRQSEINPDGSGRFHAVSVRFGSEACATARELHGVRFLVAELPVLPLEGCDAAECHCRIVHHRDRRSGEDRRRPFQSGFGGSATRIDHDRRSSPDRRTNPGDQ